MWHRLSDAGAGAAKALNSLAAIELERGNVEEAAPLYEEALAVARASGDRAQLEQVLSDLSSFEASRHNYRRCLEMDTEALGIARELGDAVGVLLNQQNLACTLRQMGRLDEAHDLMRDLVPQLLRYDVPASLTAVAEDFAAILAERGDHVLAVRLLGAADARRERLGTPRYALQQAEIAAPMAQSEKAMSPEEWHQAYQAGRIATVETALGEAAAHRVGPGPHAGP
jgi:tetratricopeptide (TPR) repeat protein